MRIISFGIIFTLFLVSGTWADVSKQRKILRTSQLILEEIQKSPDQQIPMNLISKAKAIVVFPTMLKAGFFVGARYGKGIAAVRTEETGEWGPPTFLYLSLIHISEPTRPY